MFAILPPSKHLFARVEAWILAAAFRRRISAPCLLTDPKCRADDLGKKSLHCSH